MLINNQWIKILKTGSIVFLMFFGFYAYGQSFSASDCRITVICPDGGEIECGSDLNDCERDPFGGTVTCDGITTYCNGIL